MKQIASKTPSETSPAVSIPKVIAIIFRRNANRERKSMSSCPIFCMAQVNRMENATNPVAAATASHAESRRVLNRMARLNKAFLSPGGGRFAVVASEEVGQVGALDRDVVERLGREPPQQLGRLARPDGFQS